MVIVLGEWCDVMAFPYATMTSHQYDWLLAMLNLDQHQFRTAYLWYAFDTSLLQKLLIKPLGLLWGHVGLISGEEANLFCVWPLAMGQGTADNKKKRNTMTLGECHYQRITLNLENICCDGGTKIQSPGLLTCVWSALLWVSSTGWRAGWYAESHPETGLHH